MITDFILLFILYSFIGYLAEVTACSIAQRKAVNRGFLFGPLVPVYGFGALLILFSTYFFAGLYQISLDKISLFSAIFVFVVSLAVCSALEYFTSFLLEKLFHLRYWDYSKKKFNLNGRICLQNAILFGLGGVLIVFFVHPFILDFIFSISDNTRLVLSIVLLVLLLLDTALSICSVRRAVKITNFEKTLGDQTNEIKRQCRRMAVQFFQIWHGADPRKLAEKARADFEKRQKEIGERIARRQQEINARLAAKQQKINDRIAARRKKINNKITAGQEKINAPLVTRKKKITKKSSQKP